MSAKAKGLYKTNTYIMKWADEKLWYVRPGEFNFRDIWLYGDTEGWSGEGELEGAALVAPLPILFWEKE